MYGRYCEGETSGGVAHAGVKQLYVKRITGLNVKTSERIDRIELLQTFVRIVEAGSLSAAARQLTLTQATVSRRLKTLETMLGVKLLLRTTHAMNLTEDGEHCYQHARHVAGSWSALEDQLSNANNQPSGLLRVRAPHAFGQDQLMAPLIEMLARYPGLNVEWLLNDKSPDFIADNLDCAIHVGDVTNPDTVAIQIAEVPRIAVATPEVASLVHQLTTPAELSQLPWVAVSSFYRKALILENQKGETVEVALSPRLYTDSLYAARRAALGGVGAVVLSAWLVEQDLRSGALVHVLPEWQAWPLPVWLLYPWANYYPVRLRMFIELMRSVMPDISGMQAGKRQR